MSIKTPKSELDRVDKMIRKSSYWKDESIIRHEIWMEICMEINSYEGKEKEFWSSVMDEYKTNYPE